VRQFISLLAGLGLSAGCGVLLTSHPSLTGINTGTGLSGSTAWNASVRSRLYFKRTTTDKDEEPDPDLRELTVVKANYARTGESLTLRRKDGLFVPVGGISHLDKLAAEQAAEQSFLKQLEQFTRQGRNVSDKPNAPSYAPAAFTKLTQLPKSVLAAAMERLFAASKIHVENYGRPSRPYINACRRGPSLCFEVEFAGGRTSNSD
jgi:RecA-family ATPase